MNDLPVEIEQLGSYYGKEHHLAAIREMDPDVFFLILDYCMKTKRGFNNLHSFWDIIDMIYETYDMIDDAEKEGSEICELDLHARTDKIYEMVKNCSNTNINSKWENEGCGWTPAAKAKWENRKKGQSKSDLGIVEEHFNTPQMSCGSVLRLKQNKGIELSYSQLFQVILEWIKIRWSTRSENKKLQTKEGDYCYQTELYVVRKIEVVDAYNNYVDPRQTWIQYLPKHHKKDLGKPYRSSLDELMVSYDCVGDLE